METVTVHYNFIKTIVMKMRFTRIFPGLRIGLPLRSFLLASGLLLLCYGCDKDDDDDAGNKTPDIQLVAEGFVSPLGVVAVPDGSKRLFVIDQAGKIWIIGADGNKVATPFLDVTSKMVTLNAGYDERGLLGLAFHPDYKNNGRFYIYYTLPPRAGGPQAGTNWNNLSRIAEFKVSGDANVADANSEQVVLEVDDPQSNHNGGTLAFGQDGYLYIAIGDGGAADDVAPGHVTDWYAANAGGNGQDIEQNLFGNILRIDVNSGSPYGIPADNPFVNKTGKDEIYAYGFRNPYRFSFDMGGSHELFVGDAGQVLYEEVSIVKKGGNYGWNVKEGTHCFNAANNKTELGSCPMADPNGVPLIDPVIEMKNAANPSGGVATTIIGGNVYRGKALPAWDGKYIFGIYSQPGSTPNGQIFVANATNSGLWTFDLIALKSAPTNLGYYLKGFGQDEAGELYLTVSGNSGPSGSTGKVLKLVAASE
jgi:glucose/arabinose dehydrogenase